MTETIHALLAERTPSTPVLAVGTALVLAEVFSVLAYLRLAPVTAISVRYYVYPFVWINVGLWAVVTTAAPAANRTRRRGAAAIAVGYFLVLSWAAGVLQPGYLLTGRVPSEVFRVVLLDLPPGWGPAVMYDSGLVMLFVMPYQFVGYVALAYLVYVTILDAAGSAVGGLLGLLSCVSCTWPVLAALVSGIVGGTTSVAAFAVSGSYDLSTAVFLVTVGLLYWRPTIG